MTKASKSFRNVVEYSAASDDASVPNVSLATQIQEEIRAGRIEVPVLPEVAVRVRQIIAQEGPISDIVAVIEREPAFAAAVLRYANSVAFAGLKEITDLKQAVTRLGLVSVEQTILAISARNAFKSSDPHDQQILRTLWNHSMAAALGARRIASRIPGVSPELAFLGGLLHDIGKTVILRCASGLRQKDPAHNTLSETALMEFFDSLHAKVGESLFESWQLPHQIRDVVRRHHDENLGPSDVLIGIVSFADRMAAKLGASLSPDSSISLLDSKAASLIKLDDVRLACLIVDVEDDMQRMREIL